VRWPTVPVTGWPTLPGMPRPPLGVDVAVVIPSLAPAAIPRPSLPELPPLVVPMPVGTVEIAIGPTGATPEAFTPTPDPSSPLADLADAAPPAHARAAAATPGTRTPSASQLPQHRAEPAARERNGSSQAQHRRFSFPPPLGAASPSSPAGGAAPSAFGFGLATVTGFFAFAAPGLGRRIRLARLPSPRSRSHSPLDRPG
jgi:hypothetical protein